MPETNAVPNPDPAVHATISGPVVMIGFGSIGRGTLPLIDRHFEFDRARAVVIEPNGHDRDIVEQYGFGAITIVWWEIMEWAVSEDGFGGAGGLALTYEDTVGDLFLSSTGGLIGSLLAIRWLGSRRST